MTDVAVTPIFRNPHGKLACCQVGQLFMMVNNEFSLSDAECLAYLDNAARCVELNGPPIGALLFSVFSGPTASQRRLALTMESRLQQRKTERLVVLTDSALARMTVKGLAVVLRIRVHMRSMPPVRHQEAIAWLAERAKTDIATAGRRFSEMCAMADVARERYQQDWRETMRDD